jgi:hypothetical protein
MALSIFGCSYPKKTDFFSVTTASPKKSVIYLYRIKTSVDSLNPDIPIFYVNDNKIGRLSLGGYYRIEVEPGPVKITYRTPLFGIPMFKSLQKLEANVDPNKSYFVKFSIESDFRISELKVVPHMMGEAEIKTTQLLTN